MNSQELLRRIEEQPRVALAGLPTPLERHSGILVKRDDLTALAFGGSKARMQEFYVGRALREGAQLIVTAGPPQSNHCRLTAAAAARHGIPCQLLIIARSNIDGPPCGNRLLSTLFGAQMKVVDRSTAREQISDHLAALRRDEVPFYFIEGAGHTPLGLWGYLNAAQELLAQFEQLSAAPDRIVLACGTGTTQAGLLLGLRLLGCPIPVTGISVARTPERCRAEIEQVIENFCQQHGLNNPLSPDDIEIDKRWIGPGYDVVPKERWTLIADQARQRGLLLDPLYTSRAMQATLDYQSHEQGKTVVFLHTGGLPGLFDTSLHRELGAVLASNSIGRSGTEKLQ